MLRSNVAIGIKEYDLISGTDKTISALGFEVLPAKGKPGTTRAQGVWFSYPECDQPAVAIPFSIMLDAASYRNLHRVQTYETYIQYFDETWVEQDKFALLYKFAKQKSLYSLNSSQNYPAKKALMIATDPACASPPQFDLAAAWKFGT